MRCAYAAHVCTHDLRRHLFWGHEATYSDEQRVTSMNGRANILGRLRRWKRASRHVVASCAVAYLSAGVVPCAMAAPPAKDEAGTVVHQDHAHEPRHSLGHAQHGHEAHAAGAAPHDSAPADHGKAHCPHCPPGAHGDRAACVALEDLTNVAASHAKDALNSLAPPLAPSVLTLPPPLASPWPPPPLRVARVTSVPLNIQHCVFLV